MLPLATIAGVALLLWAAVTDITVPTSAMRCEIPRQFQSTAGHLPAFQWLRSRPLKLPSRLQVHGPRGEPVPRWMGLKMPLTARRHF